MASRCVVEQGYPIRMIVPGWEGPFSVKYLSHIKVVDQPYHTWNESMNHSVARADIGGKSRWYHFQWGPKSVITRPSAGMEIPGKGYVQITGLAWSGGGKVTQGRRIDRRRQELEGSEASGAGAFRRRIPGLLSTGLGTDKRR